MNVSNRSKVILKMRAMLVTIRTKKMQKNRGIETIKDSIEMNINKLLRINKLVMFWLMHAKEVEVF